MRCDQSSLLKETRDEYDRVGGENRMQVGGDHPGCSCDRVVGAYVAYMMNGAIPCITVALLSPRSISKVMDG